LELPTTVRRKKNAQGPGLTRFQGMFRSVCQRAIQPVPKGEIIWASKPGGVKSANIPRQEKNRKSQNLSVRERWLSTENVRIHESKLNHYTIFPVENVRSSQDHRPGGPTPKAAGHLFEAGVLHLRATKGGTKQGQNTCGLPEAPHTTEQKADRRSLGRWLASRGKLQLKFSPRPSAGNGAANHPSLGPQEG